MKRVLKYNSRSDLWTSSNCKVSLTKLEAFSFNWWQFVKKYDGVLIFNNYCYSSFTSRHQSKVSALLDDFDHKIELVLRHTAKSMTESIITVLQDEIKCINSKVEALEALINKPRSWKSTNEDRKLMIQGLIDERYNVQKYLDRFNLIDEVA